jgi:hypothetical protein
MILRNKANLQNGRRQGQDGLATKHRTASLRGRLVTRNKANLRKPWFGTGKCSVVRSRQVLKTNPIRGGLSRQTKPICLPGVRWAQPTL